MTSRTPRRRTIGLIAGLAAAALALTGCSSGGGAPSGKTTISWWGYGPDVSVVNQYLEAFNKDHPDITVKFKLISQASYDAVLRPALLSNSGPDIFLEDPGARFERFQRFGTDLSPSFQKALGKDWKKKIGAIGVDGFTKDGKLMAAPVGGDFAGWVWVNQSLFDQYKLTPPKDFDEWVKVCQEFKKNNVGCFVQGAQLTAFDQDTFQSIADSIEPGLYFKAVQGKAKWDDPKLVQALTTWKDMFSNGIMQDGALGITQFPDANNDFLAGKYAMVQMGTWYMQNTRVDILTAGMKAAGNTGKPFVALPIPFPAVEAGGTPGAIYGNSGGGLAVSAKSKNKEAASTFATWLATAKGGQQIIANLMVNTPSLADVAPDFDSIKLVDPAVQEPAITKMIASVADVTETRQLVNADLATAVATALTSTADGSVGPQQAAATLQKTAAGLR